MTVIVHHGSMDVRAPDGSLVLRWAGGTGRRSQLDLWHYARRRGGRWLTVAEQLAV